MRSTSASAKSMGLNMEKKKTDLVRISEMKKEFKDYDDDTIFVLDEEEDILIEEQGDNE